MHNQRMFKRLGIILLIVVTVALSLSVAVSAQPDKLQLENCLRGAFSTEEDFMSEAGEIFDGNPYVSDGDLLSLTGMICARNQALVQQFDVEFDMGLDAADILSFEEQIVAFSTELDSPHGNFTDGDLMFNNGHAIPNQSLTLKFQIPFDIGLDAVHFIGEPDRILEFVKVVSDLGRDEFLENPGLLIEILEEFGIDIWFSVEGTWPFFEERPILDGDILSARDGIVVLRQNQLYSAAVPAGIPDRGVDFGADSLTMRTREPERENLLHSSEILYQGRRSFTDGDVLDVGGAVVATNQTLIQNFNPRARFLGLDALSIVPFERTGNPELQTLCSRPLGKFNGSYVPPGSTLTYTGLYQDDESSATEIVPRPCGQHVPVDGELYDTSVNRYRVAFREAGTPRPAFGAADGITTTWNILTRHPIFGYCDYLGDTLATDGDGWMDAQDYREARLGAIAGGDCANAEMRLAVWNTLSPRREGQYVLWLEWEDSTGTHQADFEHHVMIDNTRPRLTMDPASGPIGLEVRTADGDAVVLECGEAPDGASEFQIHGEFKDLHYERFFVRVRGGLLTGAYNFGSHPYWNSPDWTDGTLVLENTDASGTLGSGLVHLRNVDMTDLGENFIECCYILELWAEDLTIRHRFPASRQVDEITVGWQTMVDVPFSASP